MTGTRQPYVAAVLQRGTNTLYRDTHHAEDYAANAADMVRWIQRVNDETGQSPRLFVFPVLPIVGASNNRPVNSRLSAFRLDGPLNPALDTLVNACVRFSCYMALSVVEEFPTGSGETFHSGVILGPDGLVLRQPKFMQHRASEIPTLRDKYLRYIEKYGDAAAHVVADTPIGKLTCIIEVEHWVPEMVRTRVKHGAEVIVHPNVEFRDVTVPFTALKQSLAFQNGAYLLSTTAAFERWPGEGGEVFRKGKGDSVIVSPTGEIIGQCDQSAGETGEGYALATIDLDLVRDTRERYSGETTPVWDLYANTYPPLHAAVTTSGTGG